MDMSNYVQLNCINGLSKEDAEKVKEIPQIQENIETITETTIPAIQEDITTINETTIPAIQDNIDTINETTIPAIQDNIDTINETTIPTIEDDIATINETIIPDIQGDISDLDDRVTTLENTPSGTPVFHRITTGASLSNKDRVIYFMIHGDYGFAGGTDDKIYSVFIPAGVDIATGNYPITISTYYGFNKDSTTNVYGLNRIDSILLFGIGETSIAVTKKYVTSGGSGGSQGDTYTIVNAIPKNLGYKQCCIYERE